MHALPALLGPTASRGMESRRPPASRHQGKSGNLQSGSLSGSSQPQAAERRRPWLGSEMDRRGESESVSTQRPRKRLPVHANAGSSEQLAAATSESWSGELRAAKYGTEGSKHTARADVVRLAARAPPWGPRPSHPWPQRPLQEDQSRSAENLPSCVRDVVGKR